MFKHRFFCLAYVLLFLGSVYAEDLSKQQHVYTVVIDAGHGGKDAGAVGKLSREKDLNLAVSLLVGKKIQSQFPEIQVVFTRTTDVFLPLQKRADIVNANNADLFICIHTNSAENSSSHGAETFVLGTEKMSQNLDVAMRENAVMKLESDYQTTYQGFDPNSIDSYIMFELMQNQYMDQSLQFATFVQQQFADSLQRHDRGVRQAAFWVLLKSACPSVLVEMGFISNKEEEQYLNSQRGQEQISTAIVNAFAAFYKKNKVDTPPVSATTVAPTPPAPQEQSTVTKKPKYAVQIAAVKAPVAELQQYAYFMANGLYKYYAAPSVTRAEAAAQLPELKKKFPDCFVVKLPN